MKNSKRDLKTKKLVTCAILSAASTVLMLIGTLTGVLDLSAVAFSSFFVFAVVIEIGGGYPYLVWLVTTMLALLLLPDKLVALEYAVFGGIYPILKRYFEQYHPVITWCLKLSYFNTMLLALILVGKFVMHLPEDAGMDFSFVLFAVGNAFFLLYDYASTLIVTFYLTKLRKRLKMENFFKK